MQIAHLFTDPRLRALWAELERKDPPAAAPVVVTWPRQPLRDGAAEKSTREVENA